MPSFLLPGDGSFPGRGPKFCLLLAEQEHMQVNDKNASAVHVADIGSSRGGGTLEGLPESRRAVRHTTAP